MSVLLFIIAIPLLLLVFGPGVWLRLIGLAGCITFYFLFGALGSDVINAKTTEGMRLTDIEIKAFEYDPILGRVMKAVIKNNGDRTIEQVTVEIISAECGSKCDIVSRVLFRIPLELKPQQIDVRPPVAVPVAGGDVPSRSMSGNPLQYAYRVVSAEVR